MSNSQFVCGYKVTARGGQTIAVLAAALAAVPIDLTIPQLFGMIPIADVTTISGQTATRNITLQFAPLVPAMGTATLFPGENGGPIETLLPTNSEANGDYAAIPVISFVGGSPQQSNNPGASYTMNATAAAHMMLLDAFVVNPGSGYSNAATAVIIGGGLDPVNGVPGTASPTVVAGGAIGGVSFLNRGFGYSSFVQIQIVDPSGGSGAVIFGGLSVFGIKLFNPGNYKTAPTPVFTPYFQASNPDSTNQKSIVRGFMTRALEEALRSPVTAVEPVVS